MEHSFDIDIAKEYGVNCAILLKSIWMWAEKNKANGRHEYDGKFWAYNSVKAFETMFPYMSAKAIRTALQKLVDEGLIETGQFNEKAYDRTKWYCITPKGQMHLSKRANGISQKGEPIPINIISVNNTYSFSSNSNIDNLNYLLSNNRYKDTEYLNNNIKLLNSIKEWMIYKDERKDKYNTETGLSKLLTIVINKDKKYGTDAVVETIDISMSRNWIGIIWDGIDDRVKKSSKKEKTEYIPTNKRPQKQDDDMPSDEDYFNMRV